MFLKTRMEDSDEEEAPMDVDEALRALGSAAFVTTTFVP